jgi:hypothetical protein
MLSRAACRVKLLIVVGLTDRGESVLAGINYVYITARKGNHKAVQYTIVVRRRLGTSASNFVGILSER